MILIDRKTFNLQVSEKFIFLLKKAEWFTTKNKNEWLYLGFIIPANLTRQPMWVIIIGRARVETETLK